MAVCVHTKEPLLLFLDDREGSKQLFVPLKKAGLPVDFARLDFGDMYFVGRGQKGNPINIGIEYKSTGDLVNSLRTARLQGHQLPGMRAALEGERPLYDVAYLVIEGELLYDKSGRMLRRKGKRDFKPMEGGFTVDELLKRVNVMHMCAGLTPVWSADRHFTIAWVRACYRSWTDVDLDQHKSHLAMYEPPTLAPVSQFVRTARTLPGIGLTVAKAAEKVFVGDNKKPSLAVAMWADIDEWAAIETVNDGKRRKFGMLNAAKVVEATK